MSAPDQRISMLVTVCREAVAEEERLACERHKAERMTGAWFDYLPSWCGKMKAVLRQFEDVR